MGEIFSKLRGAFQPGGLTEPNTGVIEPSGETSFVGTPEQALSQYVSRAALPATQSAPGGGPANPPESLPTIGKPSFPAAASKGPLSPGLNKAGKLVTLLTSGLQGAMAGRAASERTVAESGGRRSGGFGTGFEAGTMLPWQRAMQQQELEKSQAQTQALKTQSEIVPTPYGNVPLSFLKAILPPEIRARTATETTGAKIKSAEEIARENITSREGIASRNLAAKSQPGQPKMGAIPPEVFAQLGPPPVNDLEKLKAWGEAAEQIKVRIAAAQGQERGKAYGAFRPVQVIDPETGELRWKYAQEAISGGGAPAAQGMTAMSRGAQFREIEQASTKMRDAINNLDRDFSAEQRAKLIFALDQPGPGLIQNMSDAILGTEQLTERQRDFVIWASQLQERAMSLRSIAGLGQGAEDLRQAIRATLPGIRSADKPYAVKQLDAFDQQVAALKTGIPGVKRNVQSGVKATHVWTPQGLQPTTPQ